MTGTPHEWLKVGQAFPPTALVAATPVDGPRIVAPGTIGEHLSFLVNLPAMTGVTGFTANVQGSNDNGATWTTLKQNDGVTNLQLTGARFIAAGAGANNTLIGTIPVRRIKYKDLRLGQVTVTGAGAVVAVSYVIFPVANQAVLNQVDELLNQVLPTGANLAS